MQDQGLLIKYFLNDIGELNEQYNLPTQGFTSLITIILFVIHCHLSKKKYICLYIRHLTFLHLV